MIPSIQPTDTKLKSAVVDYHLHGAKTAAAVASGTSTLIGATVCTEDFFTEVNAGDIPAILCQIGDHRRVYMDAVLGRTVERFFNLPSSNRFDDVRVIRRLLKYAGVPEITGLESEDLHVATLAIPQQVESLWSSLANQNLTQIYQDLEIPLLDVVVEMTLDGLPVERSALEKFQHTVGTECRHLLPRIHNAAGSALNPAHDEKLAEFLYEKCGMEVPLWTSNENPSVSDKALQRLEPQHPVVPLLRQYRQNHSSLVAARGLAAQISDQTGRVHGELDQMGAKTGRFVCREPNLLGLHHRIRHTVYAPEGYALIQADWSHAEYRLLAEFSKDPKLIDAFATEGCDLHKMTMSHILEKPVSEVSPEERQIGKSVNFGIIYGETAFGLSADLGISEQAAQELINAYIDAHPHVSAWVESIHHSAHQLGFVTTYFGRRRAIPEIWHDESLKVAKAERQAVNTIIQGSAADLMKAVMIQIHRTLPEGAKLLLTLHDAVLVLAPLNRIEETARQIKQQMDITPVGFSVPMVAELKIGPNWGLMETILY